MARIVSDTITGATYWASYLVNGDASGLTVGEREQADAWLEREGGGSVVSVVDGSERFTWSYHMYTGLDFAGGDVCNYVVLREGE